MSQPSDGAAGVAQVLELGRVDSLHDGVAVEEAVLSSLEPHKPNAGRCAMCQRMTRKVTVTMDLNCRNCSMWSTMSFGLCSVFTQMAFG